MVLNWLVYIYLVSMVLIFMFIIMNRVYYRKIMFFFAFVPLLNTMFALVHLYHLIAGIFKP